MAYSTSTTRFSFKSSHYQAGENIWFVGKRYVPEKTNPDGVTLLFFHCAGTHKETWEPTIEAFFARDAAAASGRTPLIREAWSFDKPNHGEAAILNKELLERVKEPLTVHTWQEGIRQFVASGVFGGHRLVAVGHSLGATTMILATAPDELHSVTYEVIILVEPSMISPECAKELAGKEEVVLKVIAKGVLRRQDTWESRARAKEYLEERFPWNTWDARVMDLFLEHGLRELGGGSGAVTLSCHKTQESLAYVYLAPHYTAVELLRSGIDPALPVHWITGESIDISPEYAPKSVMAVRKPTTWQQVPDGGHFIVQQNPDGLGAALYRILEGSVANTFTHSKL
ncbi:alpha/beta-hydrolase [Trametes polyzona]|nr:alpha/beta-hydrolase [Trametes polyzona]